MLQEAAPWLHLIQSRMVLICMTGLSRNWKCDTTEISSMCALRQLEDILCLYHGYKHLVFSNMYLEIHPGLNRKCKGFMNAEMLPRSSVIKYFISIGIMRKERHERYRQPQRCGVVSLFSRVPHFLPQCTTQH